MAFTGCLQKVNILQAAGLNIDPAVQATILAKLPSPSAINNHRTGDSTPTLLRNTAGYSFNRRDDRMRKNLTTKFDYILSPKNDGTVTGARLAYGSLILTGTTNGEDRTSASYGLGPDAGLLALQRGTQLAEPGVNLAAAGVLLFTGGALVMEAGPAVAVGYRLALGAAATQAQSPVLRRIVDALYQPQDKIAGGTAGACATILSRVTLPVGSGFQYSMRVSGIRESMHPLC